MPAYGLRLLTGDDEVDKWTDQRLWDAVLTNIRVVVATPAILLDALSHGFVHISRLALIVFDEGELDRESSLAATNCNSAHRCTKNHPMNAIMKLHYHPARANGREVPHILGLSASPVVNTKEGSLQYVLTHAISMVED